MLFHSYIRRFAAFYNWVRSCPGWTDAVLDASGGCRPSVVLYGVGGSIGG